MSEVFPRRMFPCDECPIRVDNVDNPKSQFPAAKWEQLSVTVRRGGVDPGLNEIMFGCHKGAPGSNEDLACAGWLVRFGADHVRVRLALATGRLPHGALRPGANWPALHETWDDVVAGHTADGVE